MTIHKAKLKAETAKEFVERITSGNYPTPILDNEEMEQSKHGEAGIRHTE